MRHVMLDWLGREFVFLSRVAALLCTIAICVLSLVPGRDVPLEQVSDKYRHAFAYGILALLVGCSFLNLRWWSVPVAFAIATSIGMAIEFVQPTFDRTFDLSDELANATGAAIGCAVLIGLAAAYFRWFERARRTRPFA